MSHYSQFATVYDLLTSEIDYEARGKYFDARILENGGFHGILLDLGCGTGSLSEVMAGLGYDVIGVDNSEDMLLEAAQKKIASGHDITYLCQEMTELDLYGTIDAVVCALDTLNHLTDYKDFCKAIARAARQLGEETLRQLLAVKRADNRAQSPLCRGRAAVVVVEVPGLGSILAVHLHHAEHRPITRVCQLMR